MLFNGLMYFMPDLNVVKTAYRPAQPLF